MKLQDLQNTFYAHLVGKAPLNTLGGLILPGGTFERPEDVMDVHSKGYTARLTELLGDTYKAVWYILGDEEFFRVCEGFIKKYPSQTYNLTLYGSEFSDYISTTGHIKEFPFLVDLAKFEIHFNQVFHSEQCVSVSSDTFAHFSASSRMVLSPNIRLLHYDFAIYDLWKASREESPIAEVDWAEEAFLCMYKCQEQVFIKTLSKETFALLVRFNEGKNLEEAMEDPVFEILEAEDIQGFFAWLASSELIKELHF